MDKITDNPDFQTNTQTPTYQDMIMGLGKAIKVLRITANMSQGTLAEMVGLTDSYISQIESGKRNVSLRTLVAIAEALNMTPPQLLGYAYNGFSVVPTTGWL